ncbi:MAG: hypothetical protein E7207_00565 [Clostridium butyricum]|nr:hypothetical protein [Clostridium butyricum]
MDSIKKRFESESKTRINLVGPSKSGKSTLALNLIKDGIFDDSKFINKNNNELSSIFSTEILCTGPRNNKVILYLSLKNKDSLLKNIKDNILNYLDDAFVRIIKESEIETVNSARNKQNKFFNVFQEEMKDNYEIPLNRFFGKDSLRLVFAHVNFEMLFEELNKENNEEMLEIHDDAIWNKYFSGFVDDYNSKYDEWVEKINKYYVHSEEGCIYTNNFDYTQNTFENDELKVIGKMLYGVDESCGLMLDRVYLEAPGKNNMYSGIVFIDYYSNNFNNNINKDIEERVGEDYKELFIVVLDCNNFIEYVSNIKNNLSKITLDKRIYCILNKFDFYKTNLEQECDKNNTNMLNDVKNKASYYLKLDKNKIIVTEKFNDIDKNSLKMTDSNNEFLRLLKLIKEQSNNMSVNVKVRNPSCEKNIISIKLNQERMSVQALVNMLYERYNDYLVNLWRNIKLGMDNKKNDEVKKYFVNATRTLIRNRKTDFKGYKYKFSDNVVVDFSMRSGEKNEAKKILKMLLSYGYKTVGFNSNENKVLIKVNGEISNEDKIKLINSVKGRLEECAVNYFESAFLSKVTNKKFTKNNLNTALETEENITIDDFYLAINEALEKMSKNVERYDINIQ